MKKQHNTIDIDSNGQTYDNRPNTCL